MDYEQLVNRIEKIKKVETLVASVALFLTMPLARVGWCDESGDDDAGGGDVALVVMESVT